MRIHVCERWVMLLFTFLVKPNFADLMIKGFPTMTVQYYTVYCMLPFVSGYGV